MAVSSGALHMTCNTSSKFINAEKVELDGRRIHNLSFPRGCGVNEFIDNSFGALTYVTLTEVYVAVVRAGRGCILIKRDLADAFRMVPVALAHRWLLGFISDRACYTERCLPFGLCIAPFLFNLFAEGLQWILESALPPTDEWELLHYLDDFITLCTGRTLLEALPVFDERYRAITAALSVPPNNDKDEHGTCTTVLGIEIDSLAMTARLPADKLARAQRDVDTALSRKSISLKEAQILAGFLNFCARVVTLGSARLSSLFRFMREHYSPRDALATRSRLTTELRQDLS
ncbi:hypothetical protein K505DRAFT_397112 [Melanomma pulvis-pyrius CBS 109.77]|uniref:Reverse transcriptase domain-containing protein n=1 Tax=Melanomma pulvis-pyrius CBS 109.77 TaxID=1314802 RepID=A0A6A6WTG3_9PLEO|nr:hypothetical protein K505DRAFT_397112 [Melanomma pulvis-pyrius CBS 109.77]